MARKVRRKILIIKRLKSLSYDLEDLRKMEHNIVNNIYFAWITRRDLPNFVSMNHYNSIEASRSSLNLFLVERFSNLVLNFTYKFNLNKEIAKKLNNLYIKFDSFIYRKGLFYFFIFNEVNSSYVQEFLDRIKNFSEKEIFHEEGSLLFKEKRLFRVDNSFRCFSRSISTENIFDLHFMRVQFLYSINALSFVFFVVLHFYILFLQIILNFMVQFCFIIDNLKTK
jgi:hypothetical protein